MFILADYPQNQLSKVPVPPNLDESREFTAKSNQTDLRVSLVTYVVSLEEAEVSQHSEPNKQGPCSQQQAAGVPLVSDKLL